MRNGLLAALMLFGLPLAAQDTGRIVGVVTDPTGSVVPKARITATNTETSVNTDTVSSGDGSYQILALPIGSYKVEAEAPGFRKAAVSAQRLEINQALKIDIKLEVGSSTEVVSVEASASGIETVSST